MEGRPLDHLELLSVAEKDEQYYSTWIGDEVQELAQRYLGIRRWLQFRNAITVLSRFGYFAMTTLSNNPTPGEEFCEASMPQDSKLWQRLLMVALNNELQLPAEIPRSYAKFVKDIHLVTFFLFGDFYELAKRATNFFYTTNDTTSYQLKRMNYLYKAIGVMSLVRLVADIANQPIEQDKLNAEHNTDRTQVAPTTDRSPTDPSIVCHLCSGDRTQPTSTICGHIFCWNCIHLWLKERNECPICRTPTEPSRLIHLINFR